MLLMLLFSLIVLIPAGRAQVRASLVAAESSIQPGRQFTVALRLEHQPHWHTYWINAGTGYPTSLTWELPAGWTAGEIQWPVPILIKDAQGKTTGHGYDQTILLPVTLTPPKDLPLGQSITLKAKAEWLMCAEMCIPGNAAVQISLPVTAEPPVASSIAKTIEAQSMPEKSAGWKITAVREKNAVILTIAGAHILRAPHFFSEDGFIGYEEVQSAVTAGNTLNITLPMAAEADSKTTKLIGVLAYTDATGRYRGERIDVSFASAAAATVPAPKTPSSSTGATASLAATLGLAFIGGLILNLMPCVFPVLGIKILGFVNQSGQDRRKIMLHGLVFSLGVLLSFWSLAAALAILRSGGNQLGWGFQLQSAGFVFALAAVMLLFALSLSGVFEFGLRATGMGSSLQAQGGYAGTLFTGVLATVVATPCSAPFLAPALGAALALPTTESFVVFTAIATGLALPYLLLSIFPRAVKILPRPGAWMETFKQLMAFPLYATVGYLLWVLAGQTAESGLLMAFFGLTVVAMAAWCYGRYVTSGMNVVRARVGMIATIALLALGSWLGWPQPPATSDMVWTTWSPEAVAQATVAGKTVYVDFTARWCATCQANKKLVFTNDEVKTTFRQQGIVTLKADWTNQDSRITAELAKWNRSAVPFNLVIKPGQPPQPLPELLTPGIVLEAIKKS